MEKKEAFNKTLIKIALPVTLQCLLQASFGVIDQLMVGQLGSTSIAGIGLGSKFSSLFSVLLSAIAAAAGITIAQYVGKKEYEEVSRSFFIHLIVGMITALLFVIASSFFPIQIMGIYTKDGTTKEVAASYLKILSWAYLPMTICTLLSTFLRCMEAAKIPLYATLAAVLVNTGLNYVFIFGKLGFSEMGVKGAAIATVTAQVFSCLLVLFLFFYHSKKYSWNLRFVFKTSVRGRKQYLGILLPILVCEFLWGLGENVYTAIYGHIGTEACAAMTLTVPVQILFIGALSGLSQAAGIMIGKSLGCREYKDAYQNAKRLMVYGFIGSIFLSFLLIWGSQYYVNLYKVENSIKMTASQILCAFAMIAPVKVQNMILGGGIIRSGGKTKYVMIIDFVGTWLVGVPLGLMAAFIWKMPVYKVYFILSLEECVRLIISLVVFRKKGWMKSLEKQESTS